MVIMCHLGIKVDLLTFRRLGLFEHESDVFQNTASLVVKTKKGFSNYQLRSCLELRQHKHAELASFCSGTFDRCPFSCIKESIYPSIQIFVMQTKPSSYFPLPLDAKQLLVCFKARHFRQNQRFFFFFFFSCIGQLWDFRLLFQNRSL